jgi:LmbE family N-acetylglucosaminyl deacetylase
MREVPSPWSAARTEHWPAAHKVLNPRAKQGAEVSMSEGLEAKREPPGSFDTSVPGMPAAQWAEWASHSPEWIPPPAHIVVVAPHPDDETLGAGGLIFTYAQSTTGVTVISVTDGEAARPEVPALDLVRRRELVSAMRQLELAPADIFRLGLPDGRVHEREVELARSLAKLIPDGAVIVAPFELDGHPDHEAVARACRAAASEHGLRLVRYPIWAWHRGSAELFMESHSVRFILSDRARAAKRRAIAEHRSQLEERPGGAILPANVLEYFYQPYEVFLL